MKSSMPHAHFINKILERKQSKEISELDYAKKEYARNMQIKKKLFEREFGKLIGMRNRIRREASSKILAKAKSDIQRPRRKSSLLLPDLTSARSLDSEKLSMQRFPSLFSLKQRLMLDMSKFMPDYGRVRAASVEKEGSRQPPGASNRSGAWKSKWQQSCLKVLDKKRPKSTHMAMVLLEYLESLKWMALEEPANDFPSGPRMNRRNTQWLHRILRKPIEMSSPTKRQARWLTPQEALNCRYLRIGRRQVVLLVNNLKANGIDIGLHAHSQTESITRFIMETENMPSLPTSMKMENLHPLLPPIPKNKDGRGATLTMEKTPELK